MNKKIVALVLVCVLVFGLAVGGTLAWLADKTETVTNTFTTSDVSIKLTENGTEITTPTSKEFKMVPGDTIDKLVKVDVLPGSEDCYLFIKIEKSGNYDNYLENYSVNSAEWTKLDDVDGVYYCEASAGASKTVISTVTVKSTVSKDDMAAAETNKPTLKFTAYGIQKANIGTAAAAWTQAKTLG